MPPIIRPPPMLPPDDPHAEEWNEAVRASWRAIEADRHASVMMWCVVVPASVIAGGLVLCSILL